jgi:hypothetical protein
VEVGVSDRLAKFRSLPEAEGRLLLLVHAFSGTVDKPRLLEGRLKLAKLDFLVRYPKYLARVLSERDVSAKVVESIAPDAMPLQDKMIRYRYGPWDPSYYAVLGSLIGRGLIEPIPFKHGIGYRVTNRGRELVGAILADETWSAVNHRAILTRRYLDLTGSTLKDLLYKAIPEMTNANWHAAVD